MTDKIIISATISIEIRNKIKELAEKEKRSFSNMIDLLLLKALTIEETTIKK